MASHMSSKWYVNHARQLDQRDGEVEIDPKAPVSTNTNPDTSRGAYVQAWVWVPDPDKYQRN